MTKQVIVKERKSDDIVEITLNRPDVYNCYNEILLNCLGTALEEVDRDHSIRAVILKGAGKHFSAGADVNWFKKLSKSTESEKKRAAALSTNVMQQLFQCPVPTIALVQNGCFGGGVGWATSCDVVIASEDARFAITEVRVGIPPAPILPQIIQAIGVRQARRYALTAETFDVYEAYRIGLVHKICKVDCLDEASEPVIDAILKSAPTAVKGTKALIKEISGQKLSKKLIDKLISVSANGRNSVEGIEGFSAFLEKRQPNWYRKDQ